MHESGKIFSVQFSFIVVLISFFAIINIAILRWIYCWRLFAMLSFKKKTTYHTTGCVIRLNVQVWGSQHPREKFDKERDSPRSDVSPKKSWSGHFSSMKEKTMGMFIWIFRWKIHISKKSLWIAFTNLVVFPHVKKLITVYIFRNATLYAPVIHDTLFCVWFLWMGRGW